MLSAIGALLWCALLYLGYKLCTPQVAADLNSPQARGYIVFPATMVLLSACLAFVANKVPKLLFCVLLVIQFVMMFVLIMLSGGGA